MKKRYMDFVPAGKKVVARPNAKAAVSRAPVSKTAGGAKTAGGVRTTGGAKPAMRFAGEKEPKLGKVENLNQRFVKTQVAKRPLSNEKHFAVKKSEIVAAKAQKVGNKAPARPVAKKAAQPEKKLAKIETYEPPKNKFINLSKVEKRPLSKTVYAKKVEMPKEEPQGPITIISKPEKQNHAGIIITVIITIILGAAAGTVAFMPLPK